MTTEQKNDKHKKGLPSRQEFHEQKNKENSEEEIVVQKKRKVSVPLVLVILLLLMPVVVMVYANKDKISVAKTASGNSGEEFVFEETTDSYVHSAVSDNKSEKPSIEQDAEKEQKNKQIESKEESEQKNDKSDKKQSNQQTHQISKKTDDITVEQEDKKETVSTKKKENEEGKENPEPEQESDQPENQDVYHTVKPGETLFRISMNYYHSQAGIEKIRQANGLVGNEISVGQKLTIPKP